eukprot:TRINITY_DN23020_c0_g1_i1.p1 TRINITY_DN23020_c0_g1~~TRINITY_DN23020_c0_g1_i1.p1  ORF type:complete len:1521 (+),score=251.07 TRINITY_DN23020_c0_g1_i1:50-4612(+)
MNEFAQLLLLIWKVVRFCLDVVSYIICGAAVTLACLLPWRATAILGHLREIDRGACLVQFFRTVFEIVCLCVCLPSLIIPSRLVGFVTVCSANRDQFCSFDKGDFPEYACWWLAFPFLAIAEVVGYAMGLVALLTIVRSCQTIREAKQTATAANWGDAFFNVQLLEVFVWNAVVLVVDIVFLPMLVALVLTLYRAPIVFQKLQKGFTWKTRAVILQQFVRLLTDMLLTMPSLLLVSLSLYRLPVLLRRMRASSFTNQHSGLVSETQAIRTFEDRGESEHRWFTRLQILPMKSAGLVVLDILCSPLIVLLLATIYRFRAITHDVRGTRFHRAVLKQSCELLIDIPFLLAGLLVVCFMYRADLVLDSSRGERTAWQRRTAVGKQFLRLLGDILSLVPFLIVLCTPYRVCQFVLSLKARLVHLLREDPEMRLLEWQLDLPRPKGKPRFVVRAAKSPNLRGIVSLQLQVVGEEFWTAVAQARGGLVAAAGRAMLPLALRDGKEVDFSCIQHEASEATLEIELGFNVKQRSVLKFLQALPGNVEVLLQLEATLTTGRNVVLLAVPCKAADLAEAAAAEAYSFNASGEDGEFPPERLAALRGAPYQRRDAWLPLVLAEFVQISIDALHPVLAISLLATPWRLAAVVSGFLQPTSVADAQRAFRTMVALDGWSRACSRAMTRTERLCNRYAKAAAEASCTASCTKASSNFSNTPGKIQKTAENCVACLCCIVCPCCPNYNDWDAEDWEVDHHSRDHNNRMVSLIESFDNSIASLCAPVRIHRKQLRSARKAWPEDPEWLPIAEEIDSYIQRRSIAFYWMLLLHEVHILVTNNRITKDEHARVSQAIRNRALPFAKGSESEFKQLWGRFEDQQSLAAAGKTLLFSLLREQFLRACTDLVAIPLIIFLVLTVYRLPAIRQEMGKGTEHLKMAIRVEGRYLVVDLWRLLQFLLLAVLLTATIVKLPDFLSNLRPTRGLRKARDCALAAASELVVGIGELLLLITAWKTYRLCVSAVVFAVLCPAAMLAVALPSGMTSTRCRLAVASFCWLGLLLASYWLPATFVLSAAAIFLVFAFLGLCIKQVPGWMRPRGGMDWWSSKCRCTFPNLLAVLAILTELAVLLWVGAFGIAGYAFPQLKTSEGSDVVSTIACAIVALTLLLETLPMVANEDEQAATVSAPAWRAATAMAKEVLIFPVVLSLTTKLSEHWLYCVALLFYCVIALLSSAIWDVDLSYEFLLDIRCTGLNLGGRRLLAIAAIQVGLTGHWFGFISLLVASAAWSAVLAPFAASIAWAEVLRLGASVAALAAATFGLVPAYVTMAAICIIAVVTAVISWMLRRRSYAASEIPAALQHCSEMESNLRLWGDTAASLKLNVDADVLSTARQILEFEDRLPMERLELGFFAERSAWRRSLAESPDYKTVLSHIERLKAAITVPVTRILLQQVLAKAPATRGKQLGLPLANEIARFTVPPIEFDVPAPLKGWEFGDLNLAALRQHAARQAKMIPKLIQSRAPAETKIGRGTASRVDFVS